MYPSTLHTNSTFEERIKALRKERDIYEHKMHMTDWNILMLERYEVMKETLEGQTDDEA